ncbi:hypothetical protein J3E68DRAFT_432866 [Trichoderma sp. SZMC 28012]
MDENVEARAAADEIAASPNGKVFATSSSNGTVRIWNFAHFSITYQISSDDLVTGLTFSPDSGRLYDLRGGSINAWGPTPLTRFLESQYGIGDINEKIESHEVLPASTKSHIRNFETVTAMAPAPNSRSYCVGHEDGTVILLQKRNSDGVGFAKFHNFLSVEHITWSKDGKYVTIADLAEEVQVKAPHQDNDRPLEISSLSSPQVDLGAGKIEEIMFNLDISVNGYLTLQSQAYFSPSGLWMFWFILGVASKGLVLRSILSFSDRGWYLDNTTSQRTPW